MKTEVVVFKNEMGKLQGIDAAQARIYATFRRRLEGMAFGETMVFAWEDPRCPAHQGRFFAKLRELLARTEVFTTEKALREYLLVGAGHVEMAPGPDGTPNAVAKSIKFDSLGEGEFAELHRTVDEFLWTPGAQATLWPQLAPPARYQMMAAFVRYMSTKPVMTS